ncbi:MAG: ATP-binding cassette domain-containing protein [Candidatus Micrarchaeota archaeon]|nr:ATP-binding cassette domain-containing protein [Candidatus Micrarchaeota archaeon]
MSGIIEIDHLVKKFEDFTAVDNISLDIKEGEIFGILGPNGAGKTTTINMILGLLKPTAGKIRVNGMDVNKHHEQTRSMLGFMTQETVVEGDLTARDNLWLFAKLYHVPEGEIEGRIKNALEESDLMNFSDKKAGTFSGGMQRRLALVKAMIQRPKILVLDEPTTGLDVQNRVRMWESLRELNRKNMTLIITTQYLEEADFLCNRIAIIDHGKIKAIGTPSELKKMVGTGRILEIVLNSKEDAGNVVKVLKGSFKLSPDVKGEKILCPVDSSRSDILTKILGELDRKKLRVASVNLHMPTLDDVFIKLTGSGLRDTADNDYQGSGMNLMMRGRR